MSTQRESGESAKLMAGLKTRLPRSFWTKIHTDPMQSAALDIVGCWRGWYIAIETKVGRNRPEPLQQWLIEQQQTAGAIALVYTRDPKRPLALQLDAIAAEIIREVQKREAEIRGTH